MKQEKTMDVISWVLSAEYLHSKWNTEAKKGNPKDGSDDGWISQTNVPSTPVTPSNFRTQKSTGLIPCQGFLAYDYNYNLL